MLVGAVNAQSLLEDLLNSFRLKFDYVDICSNECLTVFTNFCENPLAF